MTTPSLFEDYCDAVNLLARFAPGHSLTDRTQAALDELERLQAIVDRLPTTADGVPIAKGVIIYRAVGDHGMLEHEVTGFQFADDGSLKILMFGRGWTAFCDGWYGSREAAESARKQLDTGEAGEGTK